MLHDDDDRKEKTDNTINATSNINFIKELEIREITQILQRCHPAIVSALLRELLLDA